MLEDKLDEILPNELDLIRIVDDDPLIGESFCYLMTSEGWAAKNYPSAEVFLEEDNLRRPGCLVLDVQLDGMSGLNLQEKLKEINSQLPIIFVSAYGNIELAVGTILKGACDFIPKPVDEEKLLKAVSIAVSRGHKLNHLKLLGTAILKNWETLTPREKEVAILLAQGKPNKVVAKELEISLNTIQVHRAKIYDKLRVRSAAEIAGILSNLEVLNTSNS
ncbi:response regulator transcription factor [Parasutterella excrementihominis]|uniref:response regulator transcription factor n=1 Tax=Parasutterella excrementihominis TaxID=487175 RepID=UPI0030775820